MLDSVSDPMGATGGSAESLKRIAHDLFGNLQTSAPLGDVEIDSARVELDRIGLLFAALALRTSAYSEEHNYSAFFELSVAAINDYAGDSTFSLLLALYIQHICVLRTGTSNRSKALIAHAIQVAHDLGLNDATQTHDTRSVRLYLMICFADQLVSLLIVLNLVNNCQVLCSK